jgi:2-amino-4-hydroxy-6-hydroxymethyldihydropteridine diphosphokinase
MRQSTITNRKSKIAYLGLGSNVGNRADFLTRARSELQKVGKIIQLSSIQETKPIGPKQRNFLNQVVALETNQAPEKLLAKCKQIEQKLGRKKRQHWGPREIDLDILLYGDLVYWSPNLQIPHPELLHREFLLRLLIDITSNIQHPILRI